MERDSSQATSSQISEVAQLSTDQREIISRAIRTELDKPLTVAIMGQTGVGKSSLINTLFGTNLQVGDIRPTTKIPEAVEVRGSSGHPLTFWDMPGIGESERTDQEYLSLYSEKLIECDIVLWAIHIDTRSTVFDASALRAIVSNSPSDERRALIAKISFILTKADLVVPPPWIYIRNGDTGKFEPSPEIRERITEKAKYYQEALVRPYGALNSAETYNHNNFSIDDPKFRYDDYTVKYDGFMSEEECARYTSEHPQFAAVFERLCGNHRITPCSSLFRYNLVRLMVSIVNKLGASAIGRFQRLIGDTSTLDSVPVNIMRKYGNLIVWDERKNRITFDLDDLEF